MTAVDRTRGAGDPAAAPQRGSVLAPVLFTLRTKGTRGLATRVVTVGTRFGPTPLVLRRRLDRMIDEAAHHGFRPTCPITTTVLVRHPDTVRALADRGMEIAVHGLRHNDHLAMDAELQRREIQQAVALFRRCGIEPAGFRAPYLRADERTRAAVRAAGLAYQSDDAVVFDTDRLQGIAAGTEPYRLAVEMYAARPAASTTTRPSLDDGLVRIPVCLPDDEMLVDRLHLPEDAIAEVWQQILAGTHARGDLFTMQIHPERFVKSLAAVRSVLTEASSLGTVWTARLDEIAQWWRARAACRIEKGRRDGRTRFALAGDSRARMRLVGGPNMKGPGRAPVRSMTLPDDRLPAVGLAQGTPETVRRLLVEDGFLVVTDPDVACAVQLPATVDATDELALRTRVLQAERPVLAVDRWPYGTQSALALTGDIDSLTIQDFFHRVRENARGVPAWLTGGVR
ncbi:MAG TPA: polysaccharide deacetylase family protein [Jatrophihabitans sp.]